MKLNQATSQALSGRPKGEHFLSLRDKLEPNTGYKKADLNLVSFKRQTSFLPLVITSLQVKKFGFFFIRIRQFFYFFVELYIIVFSRFSSFQKYRSSKIFLNIIIIFKYIVFVLEMTGLIIDHYKHSSQGSITGGYQNVLT